MIVPPSGVSVSRAALAMASGLHPPYFWMARGSTSRRRIPRLLKPMETWGAISPSPNSLRQRRSSSCVMAPPAGPQLRDERGQVRRLRRVGFLEDHVEAELPGLRLVSRRHVGAVGSVLVDDREAQVLGGLAELLLRVVGDILDRELPDLIAGGLGPEDVLETAAVEDLGGDGRGDPEELLRLVHPLGQRHRVGARV